MEDGLQNKIDSIQILRFLAAFSVMMVHLPLFGFGAWGVDIFFVISGFIMMYVTESNERSFLVKRIIRIVPLYWMLTLGVFSIAIFFPNLLNNTSANLEHLIKSLFFIPFDKNGTGHFPILFLGWTLNFEIIFYLLFSISLFVSKKNRLILCTSLIILFLFSNFLLSKKNFIFSTYYEFIFLEFIFGMVAFIIWNKLKNKITNNFFNHFIFFLIIFVVAIILSNLNFIRVIHYGIFSFALLIYFLFFLNNLKFPKTLVSLGDASYCMYLLHPYIVQFFYKIFKLNSYSFLIQSVFTLIIIILVCLTSILIYNFIEKPINKNLRKKLINT